MLGNAAAGIDIRFTIGTRSLLRQERELLLSMDALIAALIDLYSLVVLVAIILSWLPAGRNNPLALMVYRLTEPALAPIRKALPPMGGLDLSPIVLLIALRFLKRIL